MEVGQKSVQFDSVAQSCPSFCDPMDCSTPDFPVHYLLEFAQTHVHSVGDAIQSSHALPPPSPALSFPMSQLFTPGGQSIGAGGKTKIFTKHFSIKATEIRD